MDKAALMEARRSFTPVRKAFRGCRKLAQEMPVWNSWRGKYVSPKGYWKWVEAAAAYVSQSNPFAAQAAIERNDTVAVGGTIAAMAACSMDAPAVFVGEQLLEALNQTVPPKLDESPNDVWPAVLTMLPRGQVIGTDGETISSMLILTMKAFDQFCLHHNGPSRHFWEPGSDGVVVMSVSEEGVLAFSYERWDAPTDSEYIHIPNQQWVPGSNDDLREIGHTRFAKNLLLLKNARPELLTTDQPTKASSHGVGFGKSPHGRQATLPTTWLGKNFVVERTERSSADGSDRGPLKPHWRRGHWHTVLHGQGKTLRRQQWFQPTYVTGGQTS